MKLRIKKIKRYILTGVLLILYLVLLTFSLEYLEKKYFPALNKNLWSFIFTFIIPLVLILFKFKSITQRRIVIDSKLIIKLEHSECGFEFQLKNNCTEINWADISSIRIFGQNSSSEDEMVMELDFDKNKSFKISDSSVYWSEFKNKLYTQFPEIKSEWESKIKQPPYNKGGIEIYHRG